MSVQINLLETSRYCIVDCVHITMFIRYGTKGINQFSFSTKDEKRDQLLKLNYFIKFIYLSDDPHRITGVSTSVHSVKDFSNSRCVAKTSGTQRLVWTSLW